MKKQKQTPTTWPQFKVTNLVWISIRKARNSRSCTRFRQSKHNNGGKCFLKVIQSRPPSCLAHVLPSNVGAARHPPPPPFPADQCDQRAEKPPTPSARLLGLTAADTRHCPSPPGHFKMHFWHFEHADGRACQFPSLPCLLHRNERAAEFNAIKINGQNKEETIVVQRIFQPREKMIARGFWPDFSLSTATKVLLVIFLK